jgi:hypothetical protein
MGWVVYLKESFKNKNSVIEYLARYTHKIAITSHRIVSLENGIVSFRFRDYTCQKLRLSCNGNSPGYIFSSLVDFTKLSLLLGKGHNIFVHSKNKHSCRMNMKIDILVPLVFAPKFGQTEFFPFTNILYPFPKKIKIVQINYQKGLRK